MAQADRPARWRQLEHTADLKVEFLAPDIAALFRVATEALVELTLDPVTIQPRETKTIELAASEPAELFLDWLREILYLIYDKEFLPARIDRLELDADSKTLKAQLIGEPRDPARHNLQLEIKSPTYHDYRFETTAEGRRAVVLFDI